MSTHITDQWLVFVAEQYENSLAELIAVPAATERDGLNRAPRVVLAAADAYRDVHPSEDVVFFASVTHWLKERHDLSWLELRVEIDIALTELHRCASAVAIEASPLAAFIVGTGGSGTESSFEEHLAPVRRAIGDILRVNRRRSVEAG